MHRRNYVVYRLESSHQFGPGALRQDRLRRISDNDGEPVCVSEQSADAVGVSSRDGIEVANNDGEFAGAVDHLNSFIQRENLLSRIQLFI